MATGVSALHANTNVSTISLIPSPTSARSTTTSAKTSGITEDTVQLSATAQQYLQSSQAQETQNKGLVEQLVRAAAAGDSGALSLLQVI